MSELKRAFEFDGHLETEGQVRGIRLRRSGKGGPGWIKIIGAALELGLERVSHSPVGGGTNAAHVHTPAGENDAANFVGRSRARSCAAGGGGRRGRAGPGPAPSRS